MTEKEIGEMKENLEKALSDKEFLKNIMNMEKVEDVQKAFAEREVKLTREDVQVLGAMINRACKKKVKPLSQEDLNEVVGGGYNNKLFNDPLGAVVAGIIGFNPLGPIIRKLEGDNNFEDNKKFAAAEAGALLSTAACTAAVVGAYKGVKWAYNKVKGKN